MFARPSWLLVLLLAGTLALAIPVKTVTRKVPVDPGPSKYEEIPMKTLSVNPGPSKSGPNLPSLQVPPSLSTKQKQQVLINPGDRLNVNSAKFIPPEAPSTDHKAIALHPAKHGENVKVALMHNAEGVPKSQSFTLGSRRRDVFISNEMPKKILAQDATVDKPDAMSKDDLKALHKGILKESGDLSVSDASTQYTTALRKKVSSF